MTSTPEEVTGHRDPVIPVDPPHLEVVAAPPARRRRSTASLGSRIAMLLDLAAIAAVCLMRRDALWPSLWAVAVTPVCLAMVGSYRQRVTRSIQTDLLPLLAGVAGPTFVLLVVRDPGGSELLRTVPFVVVALFVSRLASHQVQGHASRVLGGDRTVIVGAGVFGCAVARTLLAHPEYGMHPVGFVDAVDDDGLPLPVLGGLDAFDDVVTRAGVTRVIVAFGVSREQDVVAVLRASTAAHLAVHVLPRLFELGVAPIGPGSDLVWGFPLHHVRRAALRTPAWRTKRFIDLIGGSCALVVLLPLLVVVAILIKLTSTGPVLFRQLRVGQGGKVLEIYKFRSMRVNREADTRWGARGDDRITPIGRLLRSTSIDELPQIFNVVKGEMSLVGPRPERPHFAEQFDQSVVAYSDRLRVPVGLTGWAQVHGLRGDTSIEERARFDNYYIDHWSLWFDLAILARTVGQVLSECWDALAAQRRRRRADGDG